MDLDEYCWRKRITLIEISKKTGICAPTLSHLKNLKVTPNLMTALKLYEFSKGEISYVEMLPEKVRVEFEKWICE